MNHIYPCAVFAFLWSEGLQELGGSDFVELKRRIQVLQGCYFDFTEDVMTHYQICYPGIYEEKNDKIVRGRWNNPEQYMEDFIQGQASLPSKSLPIFIEAVRCAAVEAKPYFEEIFTREYVEKMYLYDIPADVRNEFLKIIHEFSVEVLATQKEEENA